MASSLTLVIRKKLGGDDHQHTGDQNQIIAYLCGLHGLENQVERYLALPNQTTYWAEMDRLTSIAIINNESDLIQKVKIIISDLIEYAGMADSSVGIGYYNLARLEKSLQNDAKAQEYIEKAKKEIPKLLKTRLKLDPLFREHLK